MICANVMTREPACCDLGGTAADAARIMKAEDVGAVPVCLNRRTRKLIGILTDRDIAVYVVAKGRDPNHTQVTSVMTRNPLICRPEDDLQKALSVMESHQVRRISVVDEVGQLVGIIAQADVATRTQAVEVKAEMVERISKPAPAPPA